MLERFPKLLNFIKHLLVFSVWVLPFGAIAAEPVSDLETRLRDCVRQAASPSAISACEGQARRDLAERITRLTSAILARLEAPQRKVFEANVAAWERFLSAEEQMSDVAFDARPDGLGAQLKAGAFNQLLEQRVTRLREYLSSLPN